MPGNRIEPRVHCYQRALHGDYVTAAATTPDHLRAVFAAERERLAQAARPRRRQPKPRPAQDAAASNPQQGLLQLVA